MAVWTILWVVIRIILAVSVATVAVYYWIQNYTNPVQGVISGIGLMLAAILILHTVAPTDKFMFTVDRSQCATVQLSKGTKSKRGPNHGIVQMGIGQSAARRATKIFTGLANDPNRHKKVWPARIEDYRWVVAIGEHAWPRSWFTNKFFGRAHNQIPATGCTGVVLNENWVLTAQHCKDYALSTMWITAGTECRPERGGILQLTAQVRYAVKEIPVTTGRRAAFWSPKNIYGAADPFFVGWLKWFLDLLLVRPLRSFIWPLIPEHGKNILELLWNVFLHTVWPIINSILYVGGLIDLITGQRFIPFDNHINLSNVDLLLLKLNAPLDLLPYEDYFYQEPTRSPHAGLITRSGRPTVIGLADHMHDADFVPESGRDWLAF